MIDSVPRRRLYIVNVVPYCRCYLTLTQALHLRMGGNPFGPAGTGKTESVKALGAQLGRFVLVFNCDESFDYSAMGRLFAGLCQASDRDSQRIMTCLALVIYFYQRISFIT